MGSLRRNLAGLSADWIYGVAEITSDAFQDDPVMPEGEAAEVGSWFEASGSDLLVEVIVPLASRSTGGISTAIWDVTQRLAELDWQAPLSVGPSVTSAEAVEVDQDWF